VSPNSLNDRINQAIAKIRGALSSLMRSKRPFLGRHAALDQQLVYSLSGSRIPSLKQFKYIKSYLNKREKMALQISLVILLISAVTFSLRFYSRHLVEQPVFGGEYMEGVVGTPKYINPLYASINDVDSDLVSLIYSSLFKKNAQGQLMNDLVEKFDVSADSKTYTIKIKANAKWQDGSPITANDVFFTFSAIKDQQYKSPLRQSFTGVEAQVIDDATIVFKLKEIYAGFPELLTFGIMPQEFWGQLTPNAVGLTELNLKPIGSGPYKFVSLLKDKNGNLKMYTLTANRNYYGGSPYIKDLKLKFYPSYEEALADLNNNALDGLGFLPSQFVNNQSDKSYLQYRQINIPQIKSIFFNLKSNDILADKKIRQALALMIDKNVIRDTVLNKNARVINSPILPENKFYSDDYKKYAYDMNGASKLIESAGWKLVDITADDLTKAEKDKSDKSESVKKYAQSVLMLGQGKWYYKNGTFLIIKLTTVQSSENPQVAEAVKQFWEAAHVKVVIEQVPPSQIQSDVIKTRDYEALLTGEILSGDPDMYAYWHSSQIGTEGLNLSNYSNKNVDKLLEQGRTTIDQGKRMEIYKKILGDIAEDEPAIFLYSPYYEYIQNKKVKNVSIESIIDPHDRFSQIQSWYINVGKQFK
jgi:peptide/nickel transport system substrate-binding protein